MKDVRKNTVSFNLLNLQERVAAALENSHLLEVVNQCLTEDY